MTNSKGGTVAPSNKKITLSEIGDRIHEHLKRFEQDHSPADPKSGLRPFYGAGAGRSGNRVFIRYVNYQGAKHLTRSEALHYLAALDRGFIGRHYELFRKSPPEVEVQAQTLALVEGRFGWSLYAVTRRTERRVYGQKVAGDSWARGFVDLATVKKFGATLDDLRAAMSAREEYGEEVAEAGRRYRDAIRKIAQDGR